MKRHLVRVRVAGRVTAYPGGPCGVPGLSAAVTPYGFPLVHDRSGLAIGTYPDPESAIAAAIALAATGADFTAPASDVRRYLRRRRLTVMWITSRFGDRGGQVPPASHYEDLP